MRAKVLLFNSDHTAELVNAKIKAGSIVIGDMEFVVDKAKHILCSGVGGFGRRPLYLLKWDCLQPAQFKKKEIKIERNTEIIKKPSSDDFNPDEYLCIVEEKSKGRGFMRKKIKNKIDNERKRAIEEKYDIKNYTLKKLEPIKPEFLKQEITPEMLKSTADMRFMKGMKKYTSGSKGFSPNIGNILFAIIIGGIILFGITFAMGGI